MNEFELPPKEWLRLFNTEYENHRGTRFYQVSGREDLNDTLEQWARVAFAHIRVEHVYTTASWYPSLNQQQSVVGRPYFETQRILTAWSIFLCSHSSERSPPPLPSHPFPETTERDAPRSPIMKRGAMLLHTKIPWISMWIDGWDRSRTVPIFIQHAKLNDNVIPMEIRADFACTVWGFESVYIYDHDKEVWRLYSSSEKRQNSIWEIIKFLYWHFLEWARPFMAQTLFHANITGFGNQWSDSLRNQTDEHCAPPSLREFKALPTKGEEATRQEAVRSEWARFPITYDVPRAL